MQQDRTPGPWDSGRATEDEIRAAIRRFHAAHEACVQLHMRVDEFAEDDELTRAGDEAEAAEDALARCLRRARRMPEAETGLRAAYLDGDTMYIALRTREEIEHADDLDGDRRVARVLVLDGVRIGMSESAKRALLGPCGCGLD